MDGWLGVAPHAGAWIETVFLVFFLDKQSESHPTRVRGLKQYLEGQKGLNVVRSHPTRVRGLKQHVAVGLAFAGRSHPTRVRGLKHTPAPSPQHTTRQVAPHAGAWIETPSSLLRRPWKGGSHPTRVRGLKHFPGQRELGKSIWSHPTRVRGLKLACRGCCGAVAESHPTRVRGLKPICRILAASWAVVAPHAGAWIETAAPA